MSVIQIVELHDSRIARIEILPEGIVRIVFSHLSVSFETQPKCYEGWSFTGTLLLRGVSSIRINGTIASNDRISDGRLYDSNSLELRSASFSDFNVPHEIIRIELDLWEQACSIVIAANRAEWTDAERKEPMEKWTDRD